MAFRDVVLINSAYGLGENVVQGVVNPDEFHVYKPSLVQQRKANYHASSRQQKTKDGLRS